ncbi:MAG: N-acetylglucosamine-6-phosphate deacetylase [Verrucomicrobiota bacterium]|jgi:N-acetylglucosamine-6-phosphate deacetylase|nr:N-acetylglucosamine-6-phosphate deacetylase [Verrucomicrobiota bacterium]
MNPGQIHAWNILDRKPVLAKWDEGRFTQIIATEEPPAEDRWIGPPLLDIQVNGYAGIDFQRDDLSEADLLHAVEQLAQACCNQILLTLVTDDWESMTRRLANAKQHRDTHPALAQAIVGWHIEGPFLSPETGYCGAHPADKMLRPTPERIAELRALTGDDPLLLTMAPEIDGGLSAFAAARELGIRVSIGHTNAPGHILRRVTAGGPVGFTHLGNGCPATLDRADNIVWRALDTPGLTCGLIPDRWHVSPTLFRLIHRLVAPDSIYYTTDAMAAAGAPPGKYRLGQLELEVGPEQIVRLPGTPNLAGSALTPIDGVHRAAEMLDCDWQEVWPRFSQAPARFMGLKEGFTIGSPSNFALIETDSANRIVAHSLQMAH